MTAKVSTLMLDIGGVILDYTLAKPDALPPNTIKSIMESPTWYMYERGQLTKQECNDEIASQFGVASDLWDKVVHQLSSTLKPNTEFIQAIKEIQSRYPQLKTYAFTNISGPDFETYIEPLIEPMDLFEATFTSAAMGHRKPDLSSYETILELTGASAERTIFVDDRIENILSAKSLGFHAICFDNTENVVSQMHRLLGDTSN